MLQPRYTYGENAICQQICHLFMHPFYELFSWSHWMDLSTQPAEPSTF